MTHKAAPITPPMHLRPAWLWGGMVAILLFASFLYLRNINAVSYWEDESWMAIAIQNDLPGLWRFATEKGLHPPLYFTIAWAYARFAGDGELALRWLGGLWALVGIALTYRLGADWYGRRAGVCAALLTAGSLFLLYFSRNARHFTLFYTLAVALALVYARWLRQRGSGRWLAGIALLQAALLYTHYFGAWMALVLGLHGLLYLNWRDRLRLWGALLAGGLLFLPWMPSLIAQYSHTQVGLGYAVFDTNMALRSYLDTITNSDYALGAALLALGLLATWRLRRSRAAALIALWVVLPTAVTLLINTRYPLFVGRNMIFTLGGVMVLFGAGLAWITQWRAGQIAALLGLALFCGYGVFYYDVFWNFPTSDWREEARRMAQDARPDDLFVIRAEPYSLGYYLGKYLGAPVSFTPFAEWMANPVTPDRIWLIDGDWAVRFEAIDALDSDVVMTRRVVVIPIVAEFYQRPPERVLTTFGGMFALASRQTDGLQAAPGQPLTLELWWRLVRPADFDYSTAVFLMAVDGRVISQQDGTFDKGRVNPTAMPAETWVFDERALDVPADLPPGEYQIMVAVYDWRDNTRLAPDGGRDDRLYPLTTITVR